MSNEADKIKKLTDALQAVVQKAPRAIGSIASSHFRENFKKEGFDDVTVRKWPKRKRESKKDRGRAILTKSGRLLRSVRVTKVTTEEVVISTSVPYAKLHNEGGIIHRKPHGRKTGVFDVASRKEKKRQVKRADFKMPQRQFMGNSQNLNNKIDTYYKKQLEKAIKLATR